MKLKPCRQCGRPVSTRALACPRCGTSYPTKESAWEQVAIYVATAAAALLMVYLLARWLLAGGV